MAIEVFSVYFVTMFITCIIVCSMLLSCAIIDIHFIFNICDCKSVEGSVALVACTDLHFLVAVWLLLCLVVLRKWNA